MKLCRQDQQHVGPYPASELKGACRVLIYSLIFIYDGWYILGEDQQQVGVYAPSEQKGEYYVLIYLVYSELVANTS